jgi:phage repressor protein C with HTH and peptisase S24 domain
VVLRTRRGEVMAKELRRQSAKRIEVASLNPAHPDYSFDLQDVAWMHRILWSSQ